MNKIIKSTPSSWFDAQPFLLVHDTQEPQPPDEEERVDPTDVVTAAKQKCEIIVRTAHSEAQAVRDAAYADGFEAGAKDAAQKAESLIEQLLQAIDDQNVERSNLVHSIEEQALMLCVDVAEKVIRHEVRTDPRIIARVLKMCLRRLKHRGEVNVRTNPSEVEHLRGMRDELLSTAESLRELNVIEDRRITAGGCIVESPSGDFDARIETQIEQIRRKLMDAFTNEFGEPDTRPVEIQRDDQADGHMPD
ncbi:MAG: FliH/SctL family protein [Armatimonadota bacterium]|jgi:flagellar assembly protein FliH